MCDFFSALDWPFIENSINSNVSLLFDFTLFLAAFITLSFPLKIDIKKIIELKY